MSDPKTGSELLRAERLTKTYPDGDVHALRSVSLRINAGEFVAITGPSGCGKSTLLHILGGLDLATSGEVYFRGRPLSAIDLDHFRSFVVGFVFQSFHLISTLTAIENVQIPMFESSLPKAQRAERAQRLLEEVGLAHRARSLPTRLSIGERQRVAIARALANDAPLLLADEPTGNLDSGIEKEILELLARLRQDRSLTLVVVTHSSEVSARAERVIRLRDGQICQG